MQGSRLIRSETRRTVRRGERTLEVRVITYPTQAPVPRRPGQASA
jgi:hypothetical protein